VVSVLNKPPVFDVGDFAAEESSNVVFRLPLVDVDGDSVSYEVLEGPFSVVGGNELVWRPGYEDSGVYDVVVGAFDGFESYVDSFRVEVVNVNREPVLSYLDEYVIVEEGDVVCVDFEVFDADGDVNVSLDDDRFELVDGRFVWSTGVGDAGLYRVRFEYSDGEFDGFDYVSVYVRGENEDDLFDVIVEKLSDDAVRVEVNYSGVGFVKNGVLRFEGSEIRSINMSSNESLVFVFEQNLTGGERLEGYFDTNFSIIPFKYVNWFSNITISHDLIGSVNDSLVMIHSFQNNEDFGVEFLFDNLSIEMKPFENVLVASEFVLEGFTNNIIIEEKEFVKNYSYDVFDLDISFQQLNETVFNFEFNSSANGVKLPITLDMGEGNVSSYNITVGPNGQALFVLEYNYTLSGAYEIVLDVFNRSYSFESNLDRGDLLLDSFKLLDDSVYKAEFVNMYNVPNVLNFIFGDRAYENEFEAGERIIYVFENNGSNAGLIFTEYKND
jgi:hypothetical protein